MSVKKSKLESDYNNAHQENGGLYAIKGFNFQAFSGVYIVFYFAKNNFKYEVTFEKEDDIVAFNQSLNKKYKIQAKSKTLTLNSIIKPDKFNNSIIEKLLNKHENHDYVVLIFPEKTSNNLIKNCSEAEEKFLGQETYIYNDTLNTSEINNLNRILSEYNCSTEKLLFKKMPIIDDANNSFHYLLGYANNSNNNLNITSEDLFKILGLIYCISEKHFYMTKIDDKIFKKMFKTLEQTKIEDEYINSIFKELDKYHDDAMITARIKCQKGNYAKDKEYYNNLTKNILPKYDKNDIMLSYYEKCIKIIEEKLEKKLKINSDLRYVLRWEIIYNIIEEELK